MVLEWTYLFFRVVACNERLAAVCPGGQKKDAKSLDLMELTARVRNNGFDDHMRLMDDLPRVRFQYKPYVDPRGLFCDRLVVF